MGLSGTLLIEELLNARGGAEYPPTCAREPVAAGVCRVVASTDANMCILVLSVSISTSSENTYHPNKAIRPSLQSSAATPCRLPLLKVIQLARATLSLA